MQMVESSTRFKVRFVETNSSVNSEVVVESPDGEEILEIAMNLFDEAQEYAKRKTLLKQ